MKRWTLQLSNDRELVIDAPTLEDAAVTAGEQYPDANVTGWRGEPIPESATPEEGTEEGETETTDETET